MRLTILFILMAGISPVGANATRIENLLQRMTLEEKIDLLGGTGFATKAIPRLGIPELKMTDGPLGVRWETSTAFPSGLSMAASFDRGLVRSVAAAIGREARAEGRDLVLGPCVGFSRIPVGGRNFEGMGEDPYLTAETSAAYIKGLHDVRVGGSVKHFGLNDQEFERFTINSVADERTMHEIHFVPFERAVREGIDTVMASYNKLNGDWASENHWLLTQVLKGKWGFKGLVVSDWGATHSVEKAALAGLDLEMPTGLFFGTDLLAAVREDRVPENLIDDKVRRILGVIENLGLFDGAGDHRPDPSVVNSPAHQQLALRMAEESYVLLKNEDRQLPMIPGTVGRIAVIGPLAAVTPTGGGGSSKVDPRYSISILEGVRAAFAGRADVLYAHGLADPREAVELAANVDAVILAVGVNPWEESEGIDRAGFELPNNQNTLIKSVLSANPRTVTVVNSGNAFDMREWIAMSKTLVYTSYAGQETGRALARLLTGEVNFSGRLPVTLMKRWEDSPTFGTYPKIGNDVIYREGIYLGYRHFDKESVEPMFPFGHGLSYTTFSYADARARLRSVSAADPRVEIEVDVANTGGRFGAETVQLYVEDLEPKVDRPLRELKNFERVELWPGQVRRVRFALNRSAFAFYDVNIHDWNALPGRFRIHVGSSSRDLRATTDVTLN